MSDSAPKGLVFDVQRTSLHDGPGIRTTVFLKGCPLHCVWCHNPESQSFKPELMFFGDKCTLCGACVKACPVGAHLIEGDSHTVDREKCTACGACVKVCLYDALRVVGEERTVQGVMDEVVRDKPFYEHSGGGMTVSGGEPMAQFAFTKALLEAARAEAIHTCVETCGFSRPEQCEELLPLVDLFLYDIKGTDSALHRAHTGVPNEQILENLELLVSRGATVSLRCPLVPGVNDTDEHIAGIAALERKYPQLAGMEIMSYHAMGNDKSRRIGREAELNSVATAEQAQKDEWLTRLRAAGCTKAVIG